MAQYGKTHTLLSIDMAPLNEGLEKCKQIIRKFQETGMRPSPKFSFNKEWISKELQLHIKVILKGIQ